MRMDLRDIGSLPPGSTAQVPIQFLRPEILMWIKEGSVFWFRETGATGSTKAIGSVKVLQFYDSLAT